MFLFDLFPVELVHSIFRYLWADEILHGFADQSDYIDGVLQTYDRYAICLRSMTKNRFDQMCRGIQPKQVISLAFMNEDETPDQWTIFSSRFDMRQFVNVRSFAIVSADQSPIQHLDFLSQFRTVKSIVIPETSDFDWIFPGSHVQNIVPDLKRLDVSVTHLTKSLKNLQHLRIPHCYCYRLEHILSLVPNLRSLNITISFDTFPFWSKKIPVMNYLRQFILRIHYGQLTMGQIHQVLVQMPCLIHLELDIEEPMDVTGGKRWETWIRHLDLNVETPVDIIDGNQWKYVVSHLDRFEFRFPLLEKPATPILDSFQSPFWLQEKHWFVAFDDSQSSPCLFTIPRFAPKTALYSTDYHPIISTSINSDLDQFIHILSLPALRPLTHNFPNVTTLVLDMYKDFHPNNLLPYLQLPSLHSLVSVDLSFLDMLSPELVFRSIRVLNVKTTVLKIQSEQIIAFFPQIERLEVIIADNETMILLIDGLKYLSIAKFIDNNRSSKERLTREWLEDHSSRLKNLDQFTLRIEEKTIQLWMNAE